MSAPPAGTAVLSVDGVLDARTVETHYERASALLQPGVRLLIIDLARTSFIDSSAIGMLVRIADLADIDGVGLRLRHVAPRVMRTLELAGMATFVPIDPDPAPPDDGAARA